jgi:hypothetical protein
MRDHSQHLSRGERAFIVVVATSLRQTRVVYNYILGKLKGSASLSRMIERETLQEIELSNKVTIAVYPATDFSIRGLSVACVIMDELAFFKHEGKSIDKEVIDSIRPAMIQFPHSKLIKISTPSKQSGVLYQDFKDHYGKHDEVSVWRSETIFMNPTISKNFIERELRKDAAHARSEYLAEFKEGLSDFLPIEALDAVIADGQYELPFISGLRYFGFCDPSGGRGDDMTLSIAAREDSGRVTQVAVRIKHSPFNPKEAVKEFAQTLKAYGLFSVEGDRYSAEWVRSAFQSEGIMYQNSALTKSELYLNFLPIIMQGSVTLLDHKEQMTQLRQLERKAGRNEDMIDHPRGLKDDVANSAAGSVVLASKEDSFRLEASRGIASYAETPEDKLERESIGWLLGRKPKAKMEDDEKTDEELEKEMGEDKKSEGVVKRGW